MDVQQALELLILVETDKDTLHAPDSKSDHDLPQQKISNEILQDFLKFSLCLFSFSHTN